MKKWKPKPLRAWATCVTRSMDMSSHPPGEKIPVLWGRKDRVTYGRPIRVTVVPDGTPSQAAEVRRLRREITRLRGALTFYANENAYLYQGDIHLMGSVIAERGNIARVALAGGDPMGNAERSLRRAKAKDAALRGRRGR